jgi:hypothetical protein
VGVSSLNTFAIDFATSLAKATDVKESFGVQGTRNDRDVLKIMEDGSKRFLALLGMTGIFKDCRGWEQKIPRFARNDRDF